jgi:hypothetical protein
MAPATLWPPATTTNRVALKCANHRGGGAARDGLDVSRLFAVASPAATTLITSVTSVTSSTAAIVTWRQPAKSA